MIDMTPMSRQEGLAPAVSLTPAVWKIINDIPPDSGEGVKRRLDEVLWTLKAAFQRRERGDLFDFSVWIGSPAQKRQSLRLRATLNKENSIGPAIAIKLLEEN
jgi:hypothetical protein